jgi:hypothetical protein
MASHHHLPTPQLLPDLRLALACLYNLPLPHHLQRLSLIQAQEFLIYIQSRNVRRRLESIVQRQRDKGNTSSHDSASNNNNNIINGEQLRTGSSWLASLALLCQREHHHNGDFAASRTERLFAAQTLLQRLIRQKLSQAVDWEMEVSAPNNNNNELDVQSVLLHQLQHPLPLSQLVHHYQQMAHQLFHPFVGAAVAQYTLQPTNNCDEERVKGELSLLTLTAIIYITAMDCHSARHHHHENDGPLLNTLGSAVAALALRLRFPSSIISRNPHIISHDVQQQQQPIVAMITQALSLIYKPLLPTCISQHPAKLYGLVLQLCQIYV